MSRAACNKVILTPQGTTKIDPTAHDIICGRPSTSKHPGNQQFRRFVCSKAPIYMQASKKSMKSQIVADTVNSLEAMGARFIKYNKESKAWGLLLPKDAREKVSHAIRDRVREIRLGIRSSNSSPTATPSHLPIQRTLSSDDSSHPDTPVDQCHVNPQSPPAYDLPRCSKRSLIKDILDAARMIDKETVLKQRQQPPDL